MQSLRNDNLLYITRNYSAVEVQRPRWMTVCLIIIIINYVQCIINAFSADQRSTGTWRTTGPEVTGQYCTFLLKLSKLKWIVQKHFKFASNVKTNYFLSVAASIELIELIFSIKPLQPRCAPDWAKFALLLTVFCSVWVQFINSTQQVAAAAPLPR